MDNNIISSKKIESFIKSNQINKHQNVGKKDFQNLLDIKLKENLEKNEITFSKHSIKRLENRNIKLNEQDLRKLDEGFKIAKEKNIKTPLIVSDNLICICDTHSKTVITVMDSMKDKVFTNVDGVVNI